MKGTRWALVKNPASLTGDQRTRLAQIARTNKSLYRAYLLKEQLRAVFETKGHQGRLLLAARLAGPDAAASPPSPNSPRRSAATGS